jgi:hypothetical protein
MHLLATAKPWTYWLAPLLMLVAVLGIIGVVVGYLIRVVAAKYPRQ